jgi:hypothetical protein
VSLPGLFPQPTEEASEEREDARLNQSCLIHFQGAQTHTSSVLKLECPAFTLTLQCKPPTMAHGTASVRASLGLQSQQQGTPVPT